MTNISIIGIGKLGLCMALLCEKRGLNVYGVDKDRSYLESIKFKTLKSAEPQVEEYLKDARLLEVSTSIPEALKFSDTILCFVATPSNPDHSYNHDAIEEVIRAIYDFEENGGDVHGKTLVINSTTMPNYCKGVAERLSNIGMRVLYNPTMIAQGSAINDLQNADICLIGRSVDVAIPQTLLNLYSAISNKEPKYKTMSHTAAELVKISTNCFLSLKIAYAGLVGDICLKNGVPIEEMEDVLDAVGNDKRVGNLYFKYGLPAAGVCIPRDSRALNFHLNEINLSKDLINGLHEANNSHLNFTKNQIISEYSLSEIVEFTQLSYKPNVPIITESKHLELCQMILEEGYTVSITESEAVIEQVKPIFKKYENQIIYKIAE